MQELLLPGGCKFLYGGNLLRGAEGAVWVVQNWHLFIDIFLQGTTVVVKPQLYLRKRCQTQRRPESNYVLQNLVYSISIRNHTESNTIYFFKMLCTCNIDKNIQIYTLCFLVIICRLVSVFCAGILDCI